MLPASLRGVRTATFMVTVLSVVCERVGGPMRLIAGQLAGMQLNARRVLSFPLIDKKIAAQPSQTKREPEGA